MRGTLETNVHLVGIGLLYGRYFVYVCLVGSLAGTTDKHRVGR